MSRIQEWTDPSKKSVQRPKHIQIMPTTLQEKLERIQEEIIKVEDWKRKEPDFETPDNILAELRKREAALLGEIERNESNGQNVQNLPN